MKRLLEIFYQFSLIPRCSGDTKAAFGYIVDFAKSGYEVQSDEAHNVLIRSNSPKIAFQAHYDMVCIGEQPPTIVQSNDIIKAQNGTLGADNGIGVAMMLRMIELGYEAEFLFTNDEEIGLIGAKNLRLDLACDNLINLDSESENEITIGCAGGSDYFVSKDLDLIEIDAKLFAPYEVSAIHCMGGHSGVDIDKSIISANKLLVDYLVEHNAKIFSFVGGERLNSISKNATAKAWIPIDLIPKKHSNLVVKPIDLMPKVYGNELLKLLDLMPHGVLRKEMQVVRSANLAIVEVRDGKVLVSLSVRGNSLEDIDEAGLTIVNAAKRYGFEVRSDAKYPPWKAIRSSLVETVQKEFENEGIKARVVTLHAGLECAMLSASQMVSIGPNIYYPHSSKEYVEIGSIEKIFNIIKRLYNAI